MFLAFEACERHLAKLPAVLLAMFVASPPMLWVFGENEYADLRLAATLLLLLLEAEHWLDRRKTTAALRFSVVAAAAALTKNEGLMIASIALLFMVGLVARRVVTWRSTRTAIAIVVLVGLAWSALKLAHGIVFPSLDQAGLNGWLDEHVHRHGSVFSPQDLIANAVGHVPTVQPSITHLTSTFSELYVF